MALQYQTVSIKDFGAGIDQQSSENQLAEGFCEDLRNCDPKPEGYLAKRPGYEGYAGDLPMRVKQIDYENGLLCFTFDSSVNLSQTRSSPLVVHGQHSLDNGDFPNTGFTTNYYSNFSLISTKQSVASGTTANITLELNDQDSLVYYAKSTSLIDNSNELVWPDSSVLTSEPLATGSITNSEDDTVNIFMYEAEADFSGYFPSTSSIQILAGQHGLDDFSIETKVFERTGVGPYTYTEVVPDSITVDQVDREINITLSQSGNYQVMLKQLPIENVASGTVSAFSSLAVEVTGLSGDFPYFTIFLSEDGNDDLEVVQPDNIIVDAVSNKATVSFTNNSPVGATFNIYYDFAEVQVNKICVTPSAAYPGDATDTDINLTVWGIKQEEAYTGSTASRPGWVNHIDSYRAPSGAYMVAGLGGNLFREAQRTEARNFISTYGADFQIPLLYPDLRARLAAQVDIGPVFYTTTSSPNRSRGYIQANNLVGAARVGIESVIWQSGTTVRYTLNTAGHNIDYSGGGPIEITDGFADELTVESTNYGQFNGTFTITGWGIVNADQIYVDVINPAVTDGDFDVTVDSAGNAAIYTDNVTLSTDSEFLVDDELLSDFFDGTQVYTVRSTDSAGTTLKFSGIEVEKNLPAGLRLTAKRTSSILPLRNTAVSNNDTVTNFVRGDMVKYTDYERQMEVLRVNPLEDTTVTITVDAGTATATGASTTGFAVGQTVLFVRAGNFSGPQTVTGITDTDAFTFATTETAGFPTAVLKGKTVELDESITFEDAVENTKTVEVSRRWIPIELPLSTATGTLTPKRRITYFDSNTFSEQAFIRSTMVSNNMYFTDGDGAVHKYDGGNIYRAGLFRWQPQLFVTTDSDPGDEGVIKIEGTETTQLQAVDTSRFRVEPGEEAKFKAGDYIRHTDDNEEYIVEGTEYDDTTGSQHGHINVNKAVTGSAPDSILQKRHLVRYYFRLNAIDANDNLLASAVTGWEDFTVELYESAQVNLRLVGMPVWDIYDYDRLEVEVYRTKTYTDDPTFPFYHITTVPLNFTEKYGYIDITDTKSDNVLFDVDTVNSVLVGKELGTAHSEPMRAKYITSAGNRLILANLKDYPELAIRLYDNGPRIDLAALDGLAWQFRRDSESTETGTDSDVSSALQLELTRTSTSVVISSMTEGTSFTVPGAANEWVYLFHDSVVDQDKLDLCGWWYVGGSGVVAWDNTPALADVPLASRTLRMASPSGSNPDAVPIFIGLDGNYSMANGNLEDSVLVTGPNAANMFDVADGDDEFFEAGDEIIHTDDGTRYTVTSTALGEVNVTPAITGGASGRLQTAASIQYQQICVRRMANAINAAMRYSSDPWIVANAGNEYDVGQLVIRSPKVLATVPEVVLPTFDQFNSGDTTGFNIYVNGIKRDPDAEVSAKTKTYPSRLIASFSNFAELFDNPRDINDKASLSAVDVNSADGQEITGVIPFFGDSAFGSAQKGSVIVVFKENSIYLVNLASPEPVQKIESQGLGCTAPYSIASTRDGIMFANESGMFRLTRDMRIEYIGQKMERIWQDGEVNLQQLSLAQGTHYALGRQYKLSVPTAGETVNSEVMVYNHTREYRGKGFGSWTRYDNHAATGWANLQTDAYFGAANGMVFRLRNEGAETDYRDRAGAYTMSATMRALDFGDSGRRKAVSKAIMQFRVADDQASTTVSSAPDLGKDFQDMDLFEVDKAEVTDSLSDQLGKKVQTIAFSPGRRKLVYFQMKLENTAKDEIVELAGIDIRVGGLTDDGITEAANTKS